VHHFTRTKLSFQFFTFEQFKSVFIFGGPGAVATPTVTCQSLSQPGLPDGIFSNKKYQFGPILEGNEWKKCWYILWSFGMFYRHMYVIFSGPLVIWYIFPRFGIVCQEISVNPGRNAPFCICILYLCLNFVAIWYIVPRKLVPWYNFLHFVHSI
jgi:hypothetical protein